MTLSPLDPLPLDRILAGTDDDGNPVLGLTGALTPQDGALWRGLVSLVPLPSTPVDMDGQAYGLFAGSGDLYALACARRADGATQTSITLVPRSVLLSLNGNLALLLQVGCEAISVQAHLSPLLWLPDVPAWSPVERRAALINLLSGLANVDGKDEAALLEQLPSLFTLLGAALHERGLLIVGFPTDADARFRVVQGLMALLPPSFRHDLTFTTNRHPNQMTAARVAFAERNVTSGRWLADWEATRQPSEEAAASPYIARLTEVLEKVATLDGLLAAVDAMDTGSGTGGRTLSSALTAIADRNALDTQVAAGAPVALDALKNVLRDFLLASSREVEETSREEKVQFPLKARYVERLLAHALETRDAEAALLVAQVMDADPALDAALYERLIASLPEQPDAVYAFVRARLSANGMSEAAFERWLPRLHAAALEALRVVLEDGDGETILNWLRLLAREPATFRLDAVLDASIHAAQPLARTDETLAQGLLLIAVRRDPPALEDLLEDEAFTARLPDNLGQSMRDLNGDAVALVAAYGVEVMFLALTRAVMARQSAMLTPAAIEQVWTALERAVQPRFSAAVFFNQLEAAALEWLPAATAETLLLAPLRAQDDGEFHRWARLAAARRDGITLIADALVASRRSPSDTLALIAPHAASGDFTPQNVLDLYLALLDRWRWSAESQPMMAQAARAMTTPGLQVSEAALWQVLAAAEANRDETSGRGTLRRLTTELEAETDDETLVQQLSRLMSATGWSTALREMLLTWWRGFARSLQPNRLSHILVELEAVRDLAPIHAVVFTLLAFRRMLGNRTLSQFSEELNTALNLLLALAEAYGPVRRGEDFDDDILRAEMDARAEAISPHERRILANNMSELAQRVGEMGDARTKTSLSLIRRGDDIDRQLATGEQPPHGAVDVLKWLAGYLSGTQSRSDEVSGNR